MATAIGCFVLGMALANAIHADGWLRGIAWALVCSVLGVILGITIALF
jgi:hypothetical protein